ncbi:hypothetical protein DACRYDRAFT_120031 [Dacryopinax primogenitus]|uniref:Serine/threonine-protein kinase Tel1 n=1 Tax=Dacryopinax primogenitus (strain DJM 731) TaxID=1858805 RepID=M5FPV4_DACPD|nr:uncharacterized protein DACRYDRAFT_120031 [Dacryopinax primogenitus]EJT96604.1 hypothetical protein DACRYDRAFT_120031 [Dacryopinax primogenitus]
MSFGLHVLSKGRVTERHAELQTVRDYFERLPAGSAYGDKPDDYLFLYQSLFACIRQDAQVWEKKPTPVAERRLEDAGGVLRLVVEKTIHHVDRKTFNALRNHILQSSVYRKALVPPLALNYAKMLDMALAYGPHLDHLTPSDWVSAVFRCFDVLLGRRLGNETPLDEDFGEPDEEASDMEPSGMDTITSPSTSGITSRKRPYKEDTSSSPVVTRSRRTHRLIPMTLVQREYASVLKCLFSTSRLHLLDKAILKEHRDPEREEEGYDTMKRLQRAVLRAFVTFFEIFPGETSGTEDVLCAMNKALVDLEMNAMELVIKFGIDILLLLMDIWGIKNPSAKEQLIITARLLLPFVSHPSVNSLISYDLVSRLRRRLEEEADPRGGLEPLTLDSLRLQLSDPKDSVREEAPFCKTAFRNGHGLTKEQVVTWSAMEVHADCLRKLHEYSEVSFAGKDGERESKRQRREHPVKMFLSGFDSAQESEHARVFRIQLFLFFIEQAWISLHEELQIQIHAQMMQLVSDPQALVRAWATICLAAIALQPVTGEAQLDWSTTWSLAIRRISTTTTCRSASHLLYAILKSSLLDQQRILTEIGDFSKELAVQGPTFPYDSVCAFLCECLRIARQDATLYRLQIEDKILAWLEKTWRMVEGSANGFTHAKLEGQTVADALALFAAICQLPKAVPLNVRILPPDCRTTERLLEERKYSAERDFLLHTTLPIPGGTLDEESSTQDVSRQPHADAGSQDPSDSPDDLVYANMRQRSCSTFLQNSLHHLLEEWSALKDPVLTATGKQLRRMADMVTLSLAWEALLTLNGVRFTRNVIQSAASVLDVLASVIIARAEGKSLRGQNHALLFLGLEPLAGTESYSTNLKKDVFLRPGSKSGIRRDVLRGITRQCGNQQEKQTKERMRLQGTIWRMADLQDASGSLLKAFRAYLSQEVDSTINRTGPSLDDGWAIGQHLARQQAQANAATASHTLAQDVCAEIGLTFHLQLPAFRLHLACADLDKTILGLVVSDIGNESFLLAPHIFRRIQCKELHISVEDASTILNALHEASFRYSCVRTELFWLCVTEYLLCGLSLWVTQTGPDVDTFFELACTSVLACGKYNFRVLPHPVMQWLHRYIHSDVMETKWPLENVSARSALEDFATHGDYCLRFGLGPFLSSLFELLGHDDQPLDYYNAIFDKLPAHTTRYEEMLSRSVILGNMMLPSSEVRKGPYWALISTCLQFEQFTEHVQSIFVLVSRVLGMTSLTDLFRPYAGQFAYTASKMSHQGDNNDIYDLTKLSKLFGYSDRLALASDCFLLMGPVFLAVANESDPPGGYCFRALCTSAKMEPKAAMKECLSKTMGLRIAFLMNHNITLDDISAVPSSEDINLLNAGLFEYARHCGLSQAETARSISADTVDIILTIVSLLVDTDFDSAEAPFYQLLNNIADLASGFDGSRGPSMDSSSARSAFRAFVIDINQDYAMHRPILPAVSSLTILRCLLWLNAQYGDVFSAATAYHVVTELFTLATRASLVNEQVRILRAIMVYVSLCTSCFAHQSVLRALLRGASALIDQLEIGRTSRNFLNWGLRILLHVSQPEEILPEILLRVGHTLEHSELQNEPFAKKFFHELESWIVAWMSDLYTKKEFRDAVVLAVVLWPAPRDGIFSFCDVSILSVHDVLFEKPNVDDKFPLVDYVSSAAEPSDPSCPTLSAAGFWQLKASLHNVKKPGIEHCHGLSDLLHSYACRLEAVEMETRPAPMELSRHLREVASQRRRLGEIPSSVYLVRRLWELLMDTHPVRRATAYTTLRRIIPMLPNAVKTLYRGAQEEMALIEAYPLKSYVPSPRMIEELLDPACISLAASFSDWISFLAVFLAALHAPVDAIWAQAIPILEMYPSFAERILAPLIHAILRHEALIEPIERRTIRETLSAYVRSVLEQRTTATQCTSAIIDSIVYLRNFEIDEKIDPLSHDKWLDVDYHQLSQRSSAVGAYSTALMLHELSVDHTESHEQSFEEEAILYAVYSHIEEPDGFYAIKAQNARDSVIRSVEHEGRWDLALGYHGSASQSRTSKLKLGSDDATLGIVRSLQSLGFDALALSFLGSSEDQGAPPDLVYDLAWRTAQWDLPNITSPCSVASASLYQALRAVHRERRSDHVETIINHAFVQAVEQLKLIPDDDMVSLTKTCTALICLREVYRWQQPTILSSLKSEAVGSSEWEEFLRIPENMEFSVTERLIATRVSLLRAIDSENNTDQIGDVPSDFSRRLHNIERDCLLNLAKAARAVGNVQVALNSVTQAQNLDSSCLSLSASKEFAYVLWDQGEKKSAIDAMSRLLHAQLRQQKDNVRSSGPDLATIASLQAHLGWWTAEAGLDEGKNINDQYFQPAINLLQKASVPVSEDHATVFYHYALFADDQYRTIGTRDIGRYELYIRRKQQELGWFEAQGYDAALRRVQEARAAKVKPKTNDYNLVHKYRAHRDRAYTLLKRDEARHEELILAGNLFLRKAMEMFSKVLRFSDKFDESAAVRLLARWFSHFKDDSLNDSVSTDLDQVPSHKFVFLVHQLSARMERTHVLSSGQRNLQSLMLRICKEHPFHSLYQVFALGGLKRSRLSTAVLDEGSQQGRADAAAFIHHTLAVDNVAGRKIKHMFEACDAYLEWANYPMKAQKPEQNKKHAMPSRLRLLRLVNCDVPVATSHTPIDKTMQYNDIVTIRNYEPTFRVAGGNNCPKINECNGSDGRSYKQLFKGEGGDDLRQDAVMEQVFELVNHLLQHDLHTRKRRLQMRTYRVIPLASQAGMLEFVESTSPLGSWLQVAHSKYYRNESSTAKIRERLPQPEAQTPPDRKYKIFQDICKHVRPVMRHYFTEKRKVPAAWFAMRLRYARSVAVSSIVGHILGLGDRHLSNILIDNNTGEVVHIDLGIAFDQGTLLPIPETVPFRLTRDIVDGLGTSGTDGVFQRCAENTLRVLREQSDHIKTVLEVFRYDPLHSWTASPFQIAKAQATEVTTTSSGLPPSTAGSEFPPPTALSSRPTEADVTEELNMESDMAQENADRALKSVADKLDKSLSVEYTVNRLINEARDPWNLSQIYSGE